MNFEDVIVSDRFESVAYSLRHEFTTPQGSLTPVEPGKEVTYSQESLHNFRNEHFSGHKGWVTMKHMPSDYTLQADGSWLSPTGERVLGVTRPSIWGGYRLNAKIYVSKAAFASEADLFSTLGHEITHYQNYLTPNLYRNFEFGDGANYFNFKDMTERAAYEWTHTSAIVNGWNAWRRFSEQVLQYEYGYEVPAAFKSLVNLKFIH